MSHQTSSTACALPRRFMKLGWRAAAATAVTLMAATPALAHATPPEHQPPANATYDIHVAAGDVLCGPITITFTDGERFTTFSSGVTLVTGQLSAVVTSDITGQSVSLKVSGPGKFFPDGSVKGGGAWLLFSSNVLAYTVGAISIPAGGDVNAVTIKGRRVDLCPLLGL
jgi:hypothetical protein